MEPIAEIRVEPGSARVYEEGWQSWSPSGVYRGTETSPRPSDALHHTMGWRSGKSLPTVGFQGEGLVAVWTPAESTRVWFAPDPEGDIASIRVEAHVDRLIVSADGPVVEQTVDGGIEHALAGVGARLAAGPVRSIPPGWCSWSCYFRSVTERAVRENVEAAERLELPIEVVQVDDGWESGIGDWLAVAPSFGSLRGAAQAILGSGRIAGVWVAPFLVGERSSLAELHPEWLVGGADAGWNWGQRLRVLDVSHPAAAAHLRHAFESLSETGFAYFKLDFLYAGALAGRRHANCSGLDAYREGLRIVRDAVGADAILLGCGAPLLPSIGLVDAMRVGPDILAEPVEQGSAPPEPDIHTAIERTLARAWTNGRLWVADPDSLVARAGLRDREEWAAHVVGYGGLAFSGDRLDALDGRGVDLTRRALAEAATRLS